MRRADRLFQLMLLLQEGKVRTARYLGEKLEVSDRTIYRDISDLVGSGIPIDGEAGVGYLLRDEYRLPPLMFNSEELKALALGAQMVRAWSDKKLGSTTATAIRKIESVLPERLKKEIKLNAIKVPGFQMSEGLSNNLEMVRVASEERKKLEVCYRSLRGEETRRKIWPLILYFWGNKWTLGAWCELREDFRSFRVDLIVEVVDSGETFAAAPGRDLQAYIDYQAEE
ncbi:MAG: DNA-binding transcriptional regulator [Gammaproteobacteria bacterium]|nr:DNA-binding transcriptional regulator [Gammaproteobacteria bacterium]